MKPASQRVISHIFGLLPLFAVVGLGLGLLWASAVGGSP